MLNQELPAHPSSRFRTLVLVHLVHLDDGRLLADVTSAGHQRPVLTSASGVAREVGGIGPLLGVFETVEHRSELVVLGPGDGLVLYSDGLVDAGRRRHGAPFDVLAGSSRRSRLELPPQRGELAGTAGPVVVAWSSATTPPSEPGRRAHRRSARPPPREHGAAPPGSRRPSRLWWSCLGARPRDRRDAAVQAWLVRRAVGPLELLWRLVGAVEPLRPGRRLPLTLDVEGAST